MRKRDSSAAVLLALTLTFPLHGDITGHVFDAEGRPLGEVRIDAYRAESSDEFAARIVSAQPDATPIASTKTARDGSFTLEGNEGVVAIAFDQRALRTASNGESLEILLPPRRAVSLQIRSESRPLKGARVFVARFLSLRADSGGEVEIDADLIRGMPAIVLHPSIGIQTITPVDRAGGLIAEVRPADPIRGRVVGADGKTPVADAEVYVDRLPLGRSGEDGAFEIARPPWDWQQVKARRDGEIGIAARGSKGNIVLQLGPAARIHGHVRTAAGRPAAGAHLDFRSSDLRFGRTTFTDSEGNFTFQSLQPGLWSASVTLRAHRLEREDLRISGGSDVRKTFVLDPLPTARGVVVDEAQEGIEGAVVTSGWEATRTGRYGSFELPLPGPMLMARAVGYAATMHGPIDATARPDPLKITMSRGFELRVRLVDRSGAGVAGEPLFISASRQRAVVDLCSRQCFTDADGSMAMRVAAGHYRIQAGGRDVPTVRAEKLIERDETVVLETTEGATIAGVLRMKDGSPLPERVMITARSDGHHVSTRAAADGSFELRNVAPGQVTIVALAAGASDRFVESAAARVDAPANDVVLTLSPLISITGRVVSRETRQPVTEFDLSVRQRDGNGASTRTRPMRTDDGTFVVDLADAPRTDVIVTAAGYAPATMTGVTAERAPLLFELEPGASISGSVRSADGPVAGAAVHIQGQTRNDVIRMRRVETNADGAFAIDSLAAGTYVLRVAKTGFVPAARTVEITAGPPTVIEIELSAGSMITGSVIDVSGRPVAGAEIAVRSPANRGLPVVPAISSADGSFELGGLEPHLLTITASKDGHAQAVVEHVDPERDTPLTITLERGATIRGRITGLPRPDLSMVRVSALRRWDRNPDTSVEPDGTFALHGIADGTVRLHASVHGKPGLDASATVEVRNGTAPPVEIRFSEGFEISGRVTQGGQPVSGATVSFETPENQSRRQTGPDGSYTVRVEAGTHDVAIQHGAGLFRMGSVVIAGPANHDFEIRSAVIRGRVIRSGTGEPVGGAQIFVRPMHARIAGGGQAVTDADGRFVIEPAAPGQYQLSVSKPQFATSVRRIEVPDQPVSEIELRLEEGIDTIVRVIDRATGAIIDGARITIFDRAKNIVNSGMPLPLDDGALRFWLGPGNYAADVFIRDYVQQNVRLTVPGPDTVILMERAGHLAVQTNRRDVERVFLRAAGSTFVGSGYEIRGIRPGTYRLELIGANRKVVASRDVTIIGGQTTTVSID